MRNETEHKRSFIIHFVYYLIIAAIVLILLKYVFPMIWPMAVGCIVAFLLQKPIGFLSEKSGFKRKYCGLFVALFFYIAIFSLISLAGIEVLDSAQKLVQNIPSFYYGTVEPTITNAFNQLENAELWNSQNLYDLFISFEEQIFSTLGDAVKKISSGAVGFVSGVAGALPALFIKVVLLIISTVFVSMDFDKLVQFCMNQLNEKRRNLVCEVKNYVSGTLFVCIRSYILIMSITFVELSVGLTVIGIEQSVLIAFCIAIFDILPVLGTGGIMIPWALTNLVLGNVGLGFSLLVVYIIITIVRNILEPKIVGGQLGLHPIVTLTSMFAGVQLMGVIGLFGFPIFLSLLRHLNDEGIIHIYKKGEANER